MSSLELFWKGLSDWSQDCFGLDKDRGPQGPINHLMKECGEVLENPTDLEEYADLLFLVFDATRRAGFTYDGLVKAAFDKLAKNKSREWNKPTSDGVIEHVRTEKENKE